MKKKLRFLLVALTLIFATLCSASCGITKGNGGIGVNATQLATPSGLRIEDGCLCWNPVEYASQYTVNVDGAEYYSSDYKYSLESVKDGEHVFKVKANGDGVLYTTSAFSDELRVELEGSAPASRGYYGQFDELTKKESFLGYGFDVINSSVFSDKYVKTAFPLFNNEKLMEQRLVKVDSKHSYVEEVESSSMEDFLQQWNVNASVNVNWGKKKIGGSVAVEAAYSGGVENAQSKYFHCISINNQKFYIVLQSDIETYKSILNEGFENDLYSDMEPAELFNTYGTHFITSAVMGGKINSYYLYSSSEKKSYHDFSSRVSTEVRYLVGKTDVEVGGGYRQEFESKNVYVKNTLDVIGGDDFGMLSDIDIRDNYKNWEKSLNDHASLMGIKDSSSLIPIWKLIDSSKDTRTYTWDYTKLCENPNDRPENIKGSGTRAEQLQAYFDVYGIDSYNSLMEASGLPAISFPTSIDDVRINNKTSETGEYEVYAGTANDIGFTVNPGNATGYTKTASISGNCSYARITNDKGVLALEIDSDAPVGEVLDIILSAGSVRKTIKVAIQKSYIVKFNSNGGSDVPSITVIHNGQIDKPDNPTKVGFVFAGWYTDADFADGSEFLFGRQAVTKNLALYAKWEPFYPTVSFYSEVKGGALDSVKVNYNEAFACPEDPELEGYTFGGFYANKEMTEPFNFSVEIKKDTVIYVKWNINSYTVKFNPNGGKIVGDNDKIEVKYNSSIEAPVCTKEGSEFAGWYLDPELTVMFDFGRDTVKRDMTLYAKWSNNLITIEFDCGFDDVNVDNRKINYGDSLGVNFPTEVIRNGYKFVGWYKEAAFENKIYDTTLFNDESFANISKTRAVVVYAKWEKIDYRISYKFNGGVKIDGGNYPIEYYNVAENCTISDIEYAEYPEYNYFLGWYEDEALTIPFANDLKENPRDIILYAKWDLVRAVYTDISKTPQIACGGRAIVDWSSYPEGTYDYIQLVNSTGTRFGGGNNNFDFAYMTDVYYIGNPKALYKNCFIVHTNYTTDCAMPTLHFKDFNLVNSRMWVYTDSTIANRAMKDLTIEVIGNCSIKAPANTSAIYGFGNLTITGSGKLELWGGNGSSGANGSRYGLSYAWQDASNQGKKAWDGAYGGDGYQGGTGGHCISADVVTIKDVELVATAGNGGAGGIGGAGEGSHGYKHRRAGAGGVGGVGGTGGRAIQSISLKIENSTCILTGGTGGVGGEGGHGGIGALQGDYDYGGNGGNGGRGGDGGSAIYCENVDINCKEGSVFKGGNANCGGNGGERGTGWQNDTSNGSHGGSGAVGKANSNSSVVIINMINVKMADGSPA